MFFSTHTHIHYIVSILHSYVLTEVFCRRKGDFIGGVCGRRCFSSVEHRCDLPAARLRGRHHSAISIASETPNVCPQRDDVVWSACRLLRSFSFKSCRLEKKQKNKNVPCRHCLTGLKKRQQNRNVLVLFVLIYLAPYCASKTLLDIK